MSDNDSSQQNNPSMPSAETLRRLAISESGFVFDPVSGHNFTINETGLDILRQLQQRHDFAELLQHLQENYEVDAQELERDVIEFIGMLRDFVGD